MKIALVLLCLLSFGFNSNSQSNEPCKGNNPLGFLVGDWNYEEYFVSEMDTTLHGKSQFRMEDFYGCGILQKWDGTDENGIPNFKAVSTITFNAESKVWMLNTVRRFTEGNVRIEEWKGQRVDMDWRFVFERASRGQVRLVRVTWKKPNKNSFLSLIEVSQDFGETWKTVAYGEYTRR